MSTVKHSRIAKSSSPGDFAMVDQLIPVDQSRKRTILTIGSPEMEIGNAKDEDDHERGVGGFCEKCFSCKKKIGEKDDIFMYSYLRAFCSPKCRDKKIALDKKFNKAPDDSDGSNGIESQWKLKMKKNDLAALTKFV